MKPRMRIDFILDGVAVPANSTGRELQPGKGSMPINSKYLFVASMDVDPDTERLFNEVRRHAD